MYEFFRSQLLGIVGGIALTIGAASTASAAIPGVIPGGATNEGLPVIYNDIPGTHTSRQGWMNATLYLVANTAANIEVRFHGSEASYNNRFFWGNNATPLFSTGGTTSPGGSFTQAGTTNGGPFLTNAGELNFGFGINSATRSLNNGANPPNTPSAPNFFVSFGGPDSASDQRPAGGNLVFLWLDDGAGDGTDNHDDMVISLRVIDGTFAIPLPAAVWLMIAGIGGLGLVARRRKATEA